MRLSPFTLRSVAQRCVSPIVTMRAALKAIPGMGPYVSGKHGVSGLTRSAAQGFVGAGIRVNEVAPGAIETPMLRAQFGDGLGAYAQRQPMKRLGSPHEIAAVIGFLLSDEASFVTGAVVPVDGGWLNS